jgi:hypothetical protein
MKTTKAVAQRCFPFKQSIIRFCSSSKTGIGDLELSLTVQAHFCMASNPQK